jgi:transcriptional regulator with XRE-family HTH domain
MYSFKEPTSILLDTPKELMEKIIKKIEKERLRQNITQEELAKKAGIPPATYRNFVYKKQISLINFIKILKKLRMQEALRLLVDTPIEEEITEAIEILKQKKQKKRARKSNKS